MVSGANGDRRLIVTGFGPFAEHDYNPSADAAAAVAEAAGGEADELVVTYRKAARFGAGRLQRHGGRPALLVHFGLAVRRSEVCFERCARNRRDGTPDRRERARGIEPPATSRLVDENRDQRTTRLNLEEFVADYRRSRKSGMPAAAISDDCGSYVCNALYYHSLRACERHRHSGGTADALFIHIPPMNPVGARRLGGVLGTLFESEQMVG